MKNNGENTVARTLKTTRDQGLVQIIVAEALRINCGCSLAVHVYLDQVDMRTVRSESGCSMGRARIEADYAVAGKCAEVLTVTVAAQFTMCDLSCSSSITGSVEAKLRMFRPHQNAPWKLHHIMLIHPDLHLGRSPSVYVMQEFCDQEALKELLDRPGKFHREYADTAGIDRTANAGDLLRLSQLILGERVAPLEPRTSKSEPRESGPVRAGRFQSLIRRLRFRKN